MSPALATPYLHHALDQRFKLVVKYHCRSETLLRSELKIDIGPGYRVYYTERDGELIILLAGGDKSSQQQDIRLAIELAQNL